ncbi:hypothetical protein ACFSKL_09170 [Belliella marina]|uniref:cAMP-binding domain of CRP or a regulatory subunit of cAMP-dependent protein kinases n=1 Tax=Belliella marina TaxID=1644146 RepID=A0ABW4VMD7_9BACT
MKSDFKYKMDIFKYAVEHGLFFKDVFGEIYPNTIKAVFKKGEAVRFPSSNSPRLAFLHNGAVYGKISLKSGVSYKVIKVPKSIFLVRGGEILNPEISSMTWEATITSEVTAIPIQYLLEAVDRIEEAPQKLLAHLRKVMSQDLELYMCLKNLTSTYDQIDFLVDKHPEWLRHTLKYLASYLNVSQNGLTNAIKKWENSNLDAKSGLGLPT